MSAQSLLTLSKPTRNRAPLICLSVGPTEVQAAAVTPAGGVLPFVLYLLVIALLPLFLPHFWESNRNKLLIAVLFAAPVVAYLLLVRPGGGHLLAQTAVEYVSFMTLLAALFVISGGIVLRGSLAGTPLINTGLLAVGALLASVIGTTGASSLLIRPILRANASRRRNAQILVFFIFIVSNGGGMLTPLGDPPLFLGFLRGVPFTWTLRLAAPWAIVNGTLLLAFILLDRHFLARDRREQGQRRPDDPAEPKEPLRVEGVFNVGCLLALVSFAFAIGTWGGQLFPDHRLRSLLQILGIAALGGLSVYATPARIHQVNRFSWAPMIEVAVVFLGIFVTMVPALAFLEERGHRLGISEPWQFFWAAGALSSFLDNAPTYLTFASLATGVVNDGGGVLSAANLGQLAAHVRGERLLAAVSCGSVFMGAVTYIGNGPNFMVKAIAEQHRVRMPSFFGYMAWSLTILMPVFLVVCLLFFRS